MVQETNNIAMYSFKRVAKKNYTQMKKASIFILLIIFFLLPKINFAQENTFVDSLKKIIENTQNDSIRIDAYIKIAEDYSIENKGFKEYFFIALKLAENTNNQYHFAVSNYSIGSYYSYHDAYDSAIIYYKNALKEFTVLDDKKYKAAIQGEMGNLYCFQSKYQNCLDCYLKALKEMYEIDNKEWIGIALNNIGNVYGYLQDDSTALIYYQDALKIFQEIESQYGIALSTNNIGTIFQQKKQFDKALEKYFKVIKICEKIFYFDQLVETYSNIAKIYSDKQELDKALEYYKKAIKLAERIDDKNGLSGAYYFIGTHYKQIEKHKQARLFFDEALNISVTINNLYTQMLIYKELAFLDSTENDFLNAFVNYKKYSGLRDSIYQKEKSKQIAEIQVKFDNQQQEKENIILKEQHEKNQIIIQRQKIIFVLIFVALLSVIAIVILLLKTNRIRKQANNKLELQNEELNLQKEEITTQKNEITEQRNILTEQNINITDSINYAKRIQHAILPQIELFDKHFSEYFLFNKPKDIVSGDFFWISEIPNLKNTDNFQNKLLVAAADCTGHGVPGAFMSMLGITLLHEIVNTTTNYNTGVILDSLRKNVIKSLKQKKESSTINDGLDIALCMIDKEKNEIQYSGAYRPLLFIKNSELVEIKADKQPISAFIKEKPFTTHNISFSKNDKLYLFTDGYTDQIGGIDSKKFMYAQFKELIQEIKHKNMTEQKEIFIQKYQDWISLDKTHKQLDDILVLGLSL